MDLNFHDTKLLWVLQIFSHPQKLNTTKNLDESRVTDVLKSHLL